MLTSTTIFLPFITLFCNFLTMRSLLSLTLLATSAFAAVIRDTGYGHGYTNGNGSPANCPTPVKQYKTNSARMYAIYTAYCDSFLYPANLIQVKAINSTLFSANIQGRVDITNTFDGPELNTEYAKPLRNEYR